YFVISCSRRPLVTESGPNELPPRWQRDSLFTASPTLLASSDSSMTSATRITGWVTKFWRVAISHRRLNWRYATKWLLLKYRYLGAWRFYAGAFANSMN